ncbi:MAG: hypothetical protein NTY77_06380 [Elusimicrobia bacterium]|nr:hypothetical protein [Elusimicrobiota bacterium]
MSKLLTILILTLGTSVGLGQEQPSGAFSQLFAAAAASGVDSRSAAVPVPAAAQAASRPDCAAELKKPLADIPAAVMSECLDLAWRSQSAIGEAAPSGAASDSDRRIVGYYVDTWAYLVNRALREGDSRYLDANRAPLARLDLALGGFPVFRGVVFRGSAYPPSATLAPGTAFIDPAFVSTTMDPAIAEHYAGADGYITVIFSQSGRLLSYDRSTQELSAEKEVLIPRGRSFRLLKTGRSDRGLTVVFLVEM